MMTHRKPRANQFYSIDDEFFIKHCFDETALIEDMVVLRDPDKNNEKQVFYVVFFSLTRRTISIPYYKVEKFVQTGAWNKKCEREKRPARSRNI